MWLWCSAPWLSHDLCLDVTQRNADMLRERTWKFWAIFTIQNINMKTYKWDMMCGVCDTLNDSYKLVKMEGCVWFNYTLIISRFCALNKSSFSNCKWELWAFVCYLHSIWHSEWKWRKPRLQREMRNNDVPYLYSPPDISSWPGLRPAPAACN